jgi:hypothetical protein
MTICPAFEVTSKRRRGFPSETRVKRGLRFVRGGEKELVEKLGRNDPCPCGSGMSFQEMLPSLRPVSTVASGRIIGGESAGRWGAEPKGAIASQTGAWGKRRRKPGRPAA